MKSKNELALPMLIESVLRTKNEAVGQKKV
jgi:hypothetical protein